MEEGVDAPDRPGAAKGDSEWISAAMETSVSVGVIEFPYSSCNGVMW